MLVLNSFNAYCFFYIMVSGTFSKTTFAIQKLIKNNYFKLYYTSNLTSFFSKPIFLNFKGINILCFADISGFNPTLVCTFPLNISCLLVIYCSWHIPQNFNIITHILNYLINWISDKCLLITYYDILLMKWSRGRHDVCIV